MDQAREQDHEDYQPRIVARGIWETDEDGGTTYHPSHHRPPMEADDDWPVGDHVCADRLAQPVAPPSQGYRRRSGSVWDQARADYLAGRTAEAICARYDLALGTFRHRARQEGWRRSDQADPAPRGWDDDAPAEDLAAAELPDYAAMARAALVRADRAIRAGRDLEAARWLRMHERLSSLITDYEWRLHAWRREEAAAADPAPVSDDSDDSDSVFPAPDAGAEPDPSPGGDGRTGWPGSPAAAEAGPISDDSDDSDSVFSGERRAPSPLAGDGGRPGAAGADG